MADIRDAAAAYLPRRSPKLVKSGFKILLLVSVPLLGAFGLLFLKDKAPPQVLSTESHVLAPAQHGLQAHIDPDTGRFTRPLPGQVKADQSRRALQQSSTVRKIRLQDGTLMLDLQQHYRPAPEGR